MSITLQLDAELETQIRVLAAQQGVTPERWLLEDLRSRLVGSDETKLLQQILQGQPEAFWIHYRKLIAKRQAQTITSTELEELIELSDGLEVQNAKRIEALVQLAALRGQDVPSLRAELGLQPVVVSA
jgi:hypothetical protein